MIWRSLLHYPIFLICINHSFSTIYFKKRSLKSYDPNLESMIISGSGCNKDDVNITPSFDGKSLKITFSNYYAQTDHDILIDKESCNLALSLNVDQGKQIGLSGIEYKGYTWIPKAPINKGSSTELHIDYYFSGSKGRNVEKQFYHEEYIFVSETVPTIWSSCGGSNVFEINSSIYAKKAHDDYIDSYIDMNSSDSISLMYYFDERPC